MARSAQSKTESAAQVCEAMKALPASGGVLALIETARGVQRVDEIAEARGCARLAFGTLDYAVDLDLPEDERGFVYPASRIAVASRCAGLPAPVAGVTAAIDDDARLRADLAFERALGFGAKLAIHPRQIPVIRAAMQPTSEALAWARRVLAAAEGASGAVQVDGRMIDRPVIRRAQAIVARAGS